MRLDGPERLLEAQEAMRQLAVILRAGGMLSPLSLQLAGLSHFARKVLSK
jgi:hypothetical protein